MLRSPEHFYLKKLKVNDSSRHGCMALPIYFHKNTKMMPGHQKSILRELEMALRAQNDAEYRKRLAEAEMKLAAAEETA